MAAAFIVGGAGSLGCGSADSTAARLPAVVDLGGPHMAHPQLVPILYADDGRSVEVAASSQWLVTSAWLTAVGAEYGVGLGSAHAVVQLAQSGPAMITDGDIVNLIYGYLADGTLPPPTPDTLYTLYVHLPTIVTTSFGTGCIDFDAYHDSARRGGVELAYAVIIQCDGATVSPEVLTSHEMIEAATDPYPANHPGFRLKDPVSPWQAAGGEVADLCERGDGTDVYTEGDHSAQRSWSAHAAAMEQGNPCVPNPAIGPYFNVAPDLDRIPRIPPGGRQTVALHGWSVGLGGLGNFVWQLDPQPADKTAVSLLLDAIDMSDGKTAMLSIDASPTARAGSLQRLFVFSFVDTDPVYESLPMSVAIGDPCSSFTGCLSCSAQIGCGFCATTGRCEAAGSSGSAESSCPASSFATWPGSCGGFCASHGPNCAACTALAGCGWCGSGSGGGGQCVEADHDGGGAVDGSCSYDQWSASPNYCN